MPMNIGLSLSITSGGLLGLLQALQGAFDLNGTTATISLASVTGLSAPVSLTLLDLDSVNVLGGLDASTPAVPVQRAVDQAPGEKTGTGVVTTIDGTDLVPGQEYLVVYEAAAGSIGGVTIPAASPFEFAGDLPRGAGFRSFIVTVRSDFVPGGVVNAFNNNGQSTDYVSFSITRAEWIYTLPNTDAGQVLDYQLTSGDVVEAYQSVTPVAGQLFVDIVNGSDTTGTGADATPYRTLPYASALTAPGDTVLAKSGTYPANFEPVNSGTSGNPITYTAAPGHEGNFLIRGNLEQHQFYGGPGVVQDEANRDGIRLNAVNYIVLDGIDVGQVWRYGIFMRGGDLGQLTGNHIVQNCTTSFTGSSGINCAGEIDSSPLTFAEAARLTTIQVLNNDVSQHNVITDYNNNTSNPQGEPGGVAEGITIANGVTGYTVTGNHVHAGVGAVVRQYGIDAKNHVTNGTISDNLIEDHVRYGIYIDAGETFVRTLTISNNKIRRCRHGIVLAREEDGDDSGDNLELDGITITGNECADIERSWMYLQKHPKDNQDVGFYRNITISDNKAYNSNTGQIYADFSIDEIAAFGTNIAGDPVVSNIVVSGNVQWNPDGSLENRTNVAADARFTLTDNFNLDDGIITGVDPIYVDPVNYDLNYGPGSPLISAATIEILARSVTQTAPDAITLEVSRDLLTSNVPVAANDFDQRFHDLTYEWDFGTGVDYTFQFTTRHLTAKRSARYSRCPMPTVVIRTPGVHTITCTVTERLLGFQISQTIITRDVTVIDPAVTYASTLTKYVDPNGVFTNAPAGAATFTDINLALDACLGDNTPKRIMLEGGETYNLDPVGLINDSSATEFPSITIEGVGTKPTVNIVGNIDVSANFEPTRFREFKVHNVAFAGTYDEVDGTGDAASRIIRQSGAVAGGVIMDNCTMTGVGSIGGLGTDRDNARIILNDSAYTSWSGNVAYPSFGELLVRGIRAHRSPLTGAATDTGYLLFRSGDMLREFHDACDYFHPGATGNILPSGQYPMQPSVRMMSGQSNPGFGGMMDCIVDGCGFGGGLQVFRNTQAITALVNVVVDRNTFIGTHQNSYFLGVNQSALSARCNLFLKPAAQGIVEIEEAIELAAAAQGTPITTGRMLFSHNTLVHKRNISVNTITNIGGFTNVTDLNNVSYGRAFDQVTDAVDETLLSGIGSLYDGYRERGGSLQTQFATADSTAITGQLFPGSTAIGDATDSVLVPYLDVNLTPITLANRGAHAADVSAVSPLTLETLDKVINFFDFTDATTMEGTAGGANPTIGQTVEVVNDVKGTMVLTSATAAARPQFTAAGLVFDGSDDQLITTAGFDPDLDRLSANCDAHYIVNTADTAFILLSASSSGGNAGVVVQAGSNAAPTADGGTVRVDNDAAVTFVDRDAVSAAVSGQGIKLVSSIKAGILNNWGQLFVSGYTAGGLRFSGTCKAVVLNNQMSEAERSVMAADMNARFGTTALTP